MATKGIPVFNFLPKIRLQVKSGDTFSLKAFKALLGKIADLQSAGQGDAVLTDQICGVNDPFQTVKFTITYGDGTATYASGTATLASVVPGNTITVNGLVYTAVANEAAKTNPGDFAVDGATDILVATELVSVVNADTRIGTLGKVTASQAVPATAVVTFTTDVAGTAGNAITLAKVGTPITISGATFTGGLATVTTDNNIFAKATVALSNAQAGNTVTIDGLVYTAVANLAAKTNPGDFRIDQTDALDMAELASVINADTRVGTSGGKVTATVQGSTIYLVTDVPGVAGNAITLAKVGTPITISGATFAGGQSRIDVYADKTVDTTSTAVDNPFGSEALSGGRPLDISIAASGYPFHMRSAMAAARKIEEFEVHYSSRGTASGTVTLNNVSALDTVTIGGVVYRAVANLAAEVAAGDFRIDQTDALDAVRLVEVINADPRAAGKFTASSTGSTGVVTITSLIPGEGGNQTLASSNGTRLAVSGTHLAGGGGDGVYTNVLCRGTLPTETYRWNITKLGKVYTLIPTARS